MNVRIFSVIFLFVTSQVNLYSLPRAYSETNEDKRIDTVHLLSPENPVRENFKEVFAQFGENAERLYQQYGIFSLHFLREYKIEGLAFLEKDGKEMAGLYPLLDCRDIFRLYHNSQSTISNLHLFSSKILAEFYKTYGDDGVQYIAHNPENFFLINENKERGLELIKLASEKGDIIFPLVRKHGIAFAKLYDNDVLNIVIKFQDDGLLALKEYGNKAKILFRLFINDDTFYHIIKIYGHKQTIPIIYLFYDNKDFTSQVYDYAKKTKGYEWLSEWWYGTGTSASDIQSDAVVRRENAQKAIHLIDVLGNDFLDRFEILDINDVREEAVTIITNKLKNFFISDVEKVNRKRIRQEDITLQDKVFAGLDILGLIPVGTVISKGAKVVAKGVRFAKTMQGFKGITNLTEDIVVSYGDDAVRFVAKYGDDGIKAIRVTDGKVLMLSEHYGDDVVRYVSHYGADAATIIDKYGDDVLSLARRYGDEVIKYTILYGDEGIGVIQKYGKDVVLLSSVYGDDVIMLTALYGDDVMVYASKYGLNGVKVMKNYGSDAMNLARKQGDDVIKYAGMYGDDGIRLARKGKGGLLLMRFMPPKVFTKCVKFFKYGLVASILLILVTHPIAFLSGLIKALSGLLGTNRLAIAIIIGLAIAVIFTIFLKRIQWIFKPFVIFFRVLRRLIK